MRLDLAMGGRISDIYVETFVNATEDATLVRRAVGNIIGQEAELQEQAVEGSFGNPITILRARVSRKREVEAVIGRIASWEAFRISLDRAGERLDANGVYHMRIDKASAFEGSPKLWAGGEGIDVRMKVVTYPFSYEDALSFIMGLAPPSGQR